MDALIVIACWYGIGVLVAGWMVWHGHSSPAWWILAVLLGVAVVLLAAPARVAARRRSPRVTVDLRQQPSSARSASRIRALVIARPRTEIAVAAHAGVAAGEVSVVVVVGHEGLERWISTGERAVAEEALDRWRATPGVVRASMTSGTVADAVDAVAEIVEDLDVIVLPVASAAWRSLPDVASAISAAADLGLPVLVVPPEGAAATSEDSIEPIETWSTAA